MASTPDATAVTAPAAVIEPGHTRADLRRLRQALAGGWDIPAELREQLPRVVVGMIRDARNDRDRLRAIEVLVAMQRDNVQAVALADRIERLDSGEATERVELLPIRIGVRE
jgi:hypothetical protein